MKHKVMMWGPLAMAAVLALSACSEAPSTTGEGGTKAGPGVSEDAINVLAINDLSGPAASGGKPVQAGLDAYVDMVNESGGIEGRKINLITADTQYDPQKAARAYQSERNDIAAAWSYGSPTTDAIRPFAAEDGVLLLPIKGNFPEDNTFSVMGSYEVDTATLLTHALEENPDAKLGVIYQSDAMGDSVKRGVDAALDELGKETVAEASVEATSQDLTAQMTAMRRAGADTIMLGVGPGALIAGAGAVAQLGMDDAVLLNPGSGYTRSLLDLPVADVLVDQLLSSCAYPLWDEETEAVQEFKDAMGDVEPHGSYINGWTSGMVLTAILRQAAESGDLSREGVVAAASAATIDMKGLTPEIDYGTSIDERTPYRKSRVCSVVKDDDGFELVKDWFGTPAADSVRLD